MSPKSRIRLCLFVYVCILTLTLVDSEPNSGIYTLIPLGIFSFITTAATGFYMAFLMSRKPAEKTILNRQILMNFCFKIPVYLQGYLIVCVKQISRTRPLNVFEQFLGSTVLSYFGCRLVIVVSISMYILISVARTLVFLSPVGFISMKTKKFQFISMLIVLALFIQEVVLSQTLFSADKCNVDQNGYALHSLAFTKYNRTSTDSLTVTRFNEILNDSLALTRNNSTLTETVKVCKPIPTIEILIVLLIVLETIRLIAAVVRKLKQIKKRNKSVVPKRVKPNKENQTLMASSFIEPNADGKGARAEIAASDEPTTDTHTSGVPKSDGERAASDGTRAERAASNGTRAERAASDRTREDRAASDGTRAERAISDGTR